MNCGFLSEHMQRMFIYSNIQHTNLTPDKAEHSDYMERLPVFVYIELHFYTLLKMVRFLAHSLHVVLCLV